MSIDDEKLSRSDRFGVRLINGRADRTSRRGVLARLGRIMLSTLGVTVVQQLPVGRVRTVHAMYPCDCTPWFLCGIWGRVCCASASCGSESCFGGCPPDTNYSLNSWTGCCYNPVDGKDHVVTYYDCCDPTWSRDCGQCPWCTNGPEEPSWCTGQGGYICTVPVISGAECF